MGPHLARTADAGLHFIQSQQQPVFIAHGAQFAQETKRRRAHAAFTLHGFNHHAGCIGANRVTHRIHIVEGHMVEAFNRRAEAGQIFLIPSGGQRGHGAAMEGAIKADQPVAFWVAVLRVVFADSLDHALIRFGAGIAEKHAVSEGVFHMPLRQPFRLRDAIQVGGMNDLAGLFRNHPRQMLVPVAERGGRDARAEIQETSSIFRPKSRAFAPLKSKVGTVIGRHQGGNHVSSLRKLPARAKATIAPPRTGKEKLAGKARKMKEAPWFIRQYSSKRLGPAPPGIAP